MTAGDVVIREARDEDGPALCALIQPIFEEYEGVIFVLDEMPELLRIASYVAAHDGRFWCAFEGEELVGSVGFTRALQGDGVELKKLYVARRARRSGLGGRLAARVEEAAAAAGASFVELWSDVKFETAHRFYERRGYRRDGRTRELRDLSGTVEYHFEKTLG